MTVTTEDVRIAIPRELRSLADGATEFRVHARDVRGALAELARRQPQIHVRLCDERGDPRPHINVFINEEFCPRAELGTPVSAGDVITILPAVSGG